MSECDCLGCDNEARWPWGYCSDACKNWALQNLARRVEGEDPLPGPSNSTPEGATAQATVGEPVVAEIDADATASLGDINVTVNAAFDDLRGELDDIFSEIDNLKRELDREITAVERELENETRNLRREIDRGLRD